MGKQTRSLSSLADKTARMLAENEVAPGKGVKGTLTIDAAAGVSRTFRAHWTGYRLHYEDPTLVLVAKTNDGLFFSEGYISTTDQASFILAFRAEPHASRGTGAERPDDKFASPQSIEIAHEQRRAMEGVGGAFAEEIIRYEDSNDADEAIEQFFNYTTNYCLKSANLTWADFGFVLEGSVEGYFNKGAAPPQMAAAVDEGLKRSDILWLAPDTSPGRSIPCWFIYTKDKRVFILSGEREQTIPDATRIRNARIVTRRKGRDAALGSFDASVRAITPEDDEFDEIAELLVAKRQSARGSVKENIERWKREQATILELAPRA